MNIKKIITTGIMALAALAASAEPTVTDVVAKQRYPWNGLVDITCNVTGISGAANEFHTFALSAVMPDLGDIRHLSEFHGVPRGTEVNANGNYHLVWDAWADLGQVIYSNMVVRVTIETFRDKVQLWDGGPYWAGKNIGANAPWEYGYYFWWGDTVGYKRENNKWVASDGSSVNYSFATTNTPTRNKSIATLKSEGWITADEILVPAHDAAHVHWGGAWRMPTKQELSDLNSKCDWSWTTRNGVKGYVVKGKGAYAAASIFLPCAGYGEWTSLRNAGSYGDYWSSVPSSGSSYYNVRAWYLHFSSSDRYTDDDYQIRDDGQSVRPVQGFTE